MKTTLTELIDHRWQELKEAAKAESWTATKDAFEQMVKLQEINEAVAKEFASDVGSNHSHEPPNAAAPVTSLGKKPTVRPRELRINACKIPISLSNQIAIETANWILDQGKKLPIIPGFVNSTDSGFSSTAVKRNLKDGSIIEVGLEQGTLVKKARQLLNAAGLAHSKAEVLLENGEVKAI
jgi:hypothetical protein